MSTHPSLSPELVNRLHSMHKALMRLHKSLLDAERAAYERVNGPIATATQVLQLVMEDPWFHWLHRISQMIIAIDEVTEPATGLSSRHSRTADSPVSREERAKSLIQQAQALFRPSTETNAADQTFINRYRAVLQRDPSAVTAHAEVLRSLFPKD